MITKTATTKHNSNGNGTRPKTLPYSPVFQTRVLQLCLEDRAWLPYLKPAYFDRPLDGQALKLLQTMPPPVSLRTLAEECRTKLGVPATLTILRRLTKRPLTEADRVQLTTKLSDFIRFQGRGELFIDASKAYQAQDLAGLERVWQRGHLSLPGADPLPLMNMADVKMERIQWKWKAHLAAGMLHLIGGEPGEGKSAVVLDLGARLTRGGAWPDGTPGSGTPEVVVILSAKDTASHTIKPRLLAAGADMTKIKVYDVTMPGVRSFLLDDLPALERQLRQLKASMLIIDSVNDFLPNVNTWHINETKAALGAWHSMAARLGLVIIAITHLAKPSVERTAAQRFIGSVGFLAQARLSFLVARDPKDLTRTHKLLMPTKNQFGPEPQSLAFTMAPKRVTADGVTVEAPRLFWMRAGQRDPSTVLRDLQRGLRPKDIAVQLLKHELRHGPVLAKMVLRTLKARDVPTKTARRVKDRLKIESAQRGGRWYWMPPDWTPTQVTAWQANGGSDGHPRSLRKVAT